MQTNACSDRGLDGTLNVTDGRLLRDLVDGDADVMPHALGGSGEASPAAPART